MAGRSESPALQHPGGGLLSVKQVSVMLGISRSKVYELIASRELVAYRPGGRIRVSPRAVKEYLENCRI